MRTQPRFEFALAGETEDDELRTLLCHTPLPGEITLSFLREPSFFLAEQAGSIASQVMICKDRQRAQIVGMGSRSIRHVYIDGKPAQVGYLSMLRGLPEARGNIALARGYQYLRTLHSDDAVPYYFTTILDENTQARTLLTSERAVLPTYRPIAHLRTYLIPLKTRRKGKEIGNAVSKVERQQLPDVMAFLQAWNSQYQFAPLYTLQDVLGQSSLLPHFSWEDLYIYRDHGTITGCVGVWDQQPFKQTIVTDYSRKMRLVQPFYNLLANIKGEPGLPRVGTQIKYLYTIGLSGPKDIGEMLLRRVRADWSGRGYDYLAVGLCDGHELAPLASAFSTYQISSTVYIVYWRDGKNVSLPQADRRAHLEIATL
jgi:hypothetical protein